MSFCHRRTSFIVGRIAVCLVLSGRLFGDTAGFKRKTFGTPTCCAAPDNADNSEAVGHKVFCRQRRLLHFPVSDNYFLLFWQVINTACQVEQGTVISPLDELRPLGEILRSDIKEKNFSLQQILRNLLRADFFWFYAFIFVVNIKCIVKTAPFIDPALKPIYCFIPFIDGKPCRPFRVRSQ